MNSLGVYFPSLADPVLLLNRIKYEPFSKNQDDYYIPHNLLVLKAEDSKIINVHDECLKTAALFLSWGQGRGDEGGTEKHWEKPLSPLICRHYLFFYFIYFFLSFLTEDQPLKHQKQLTLFTVKQNEKWVPGLAVLSLYKDNPCGRDKKPTHCQFTSMWMRRNKTRGWCIFINNCQSLLFCCMQIH